MRKEENKITASTRLPLQRSYVNGSYLSNQSGDTFVTRYPGNDQPVCEIEIAGQAEIDAAVQGGLDAFESWSQTSAVERSVSALGNTGQPVPIL